MAFGPRTAMMTGRRGVTRHSSNSAVHLRAFVTFRQRTGELRELVPGDLIGRIWTAALSIPDPLVSEAHAMVSLREGALKLLGLRGRLAVGGRAVTEVTLSAGLKIGLSPRTELEVVEVEVGRGGGRVLAGAGGVAVGAREREDERVDALAGRVEEEADRIAIGLGTVDLGRAVDVLEVHGDVEEALARVAHDGEIELDPGVLVLAAGDRELAAVGRGACQSGDAQWGSRAWSLPARQEKG